jgi:hypothetical protein
MVASCRGVVNVQSLEEVLRHFVGEFFSLVGDKFQWQAVTTDPTIQNGGRHRQRLFVGEYNKFHIFCKCISDAQNKFSVAIRIFQRAEEVGVYTLIWLCALR